MKSYVSGFAAALGCFLPVALVLAILDVMHAGAGAAPILGLWALVSLPFALVVGLVLGAGNATWGDGFVRRGMRALRDKPDLDRTIAGAMMASAFVAGVIALVISKLVGPLVVAVEHKSTGALLLGIVSVALVPALAGLAIPAYRLTRWIAKVIPAIGPMSRVAMLLVAAVVAIVSAALFIMFAQLDAAALKLTRMFILLALPVGAFVLGVLAFGPLAKVREGIPASARVGAAAAGAIAAVLAIAVGLPGTPSNEVKSAVIDQSYLGSMAIPQLRKMIDHDGDGVSAFFGGPDCDDNDAHVYPGAPEMENDCDARDADVKPVTNPGSGSNPAPVAHDAGVAASDAGPPVPTPVTAMADNVLIIFVDTLRYDHLGFAGYKREDKSLTPRIDAFAKDAVVFKHAYSQAPNTPRSVPSFMSSKFPSQIHFDKQFKSYATVLDDNDLMFETLKAGGFATFGESSHFYFCDEKNRPGDCDHPNPKHSNVNQGVDVWDNSKSLDLAGSNHDISGPRIVKKTITKLDELADKKTKFAMMVHLFDPHSTYMTHDKFTYKGGKGALMEKYDYEVAFEDEQIGEILDALDKNGLAKTTAVVLMADHGEAFGEHVVYGEADYFHGDTVYNELVHVPLVFRLPGKPGCEREDVVQLVDLAPTVAAIAGLPPAQSWVGRSLTPAMACGSASTLSPQPAYSELLPEPMWDHAGRSMVTADGKHQIYNRSSDGQWELYDLEADPLEKTNVMESQPDLGKKLKGELAGWVHGALKQGRSPGAAKGKDDDK